MTLPNLTQAPFNATLLGCLRGAADYYRLDVSTPMLYGAGGHAFVMNIHREICPSGPYCFDRAPLWGLLEGLGLKVTDLGFYWHESPADDRAAVERRLVAALDAGLPCFLVNMEFQLITGYDETGMQTAQPWPAMDFPQAHVTFGTWAEMGGEIHVNFHTIERCEPAPRRAAMAAGLRYGAGLWLDPPADTGDYGVGARAYENWIAAVAAGGGGSHGNWWNGTVWAECRDQAAAFLREIAAGEADVAGRAGDLAAAYDNLARLVRLASDKALEATEKVAVLEQAAAAERQAVEGLVHLAGELA